jgi:alkylation response protein AidB-like acyl-CoA dehydrogenase
VGRRRSGLRQLRAGIEAIAKASATVAASLVVTNSLVAELIATLAPKRRRNDGCGRLATGAVIGAFALSEPDAGTDAANQRARAVREGGRFRITGRKCGSPTRRPPVWWSCSRRRGWGNARKGSRRFVPMDTPGITRTARHESLGVRGLGCTDLELDISVADDQVLGDVDQDSLSPSGR